MQKSSNQNKSTVIIKNKPIYNINLDAMLKLPAFVYWKNTEGYYLGCNSYLIEIAGQKIVDATVFDLMLSEYAVSVNANDEKVIVEEKNVTLFEDCKYFSENYVTCISLKIPLYLANGNLAGMFGISIEVDKLNSDTGLLSRLTESNLINKQNIDLKLDKYLFEKNLNNKYKLTEREKQCVLYLSKGRTVKEIARYLELSPCTVESYIDNVKSKLGCNNKNQILEMLNL